MTYERPDIKMMDTLDAFFARLLRKTFTLPADMDWRAKKLTEFIDSHAGKVRGSFDDLCIQLGLTMSGRQARRLFKGLTRISIREYAKNRRLVVAANQLRVTNMPIKAVAVDAGYQRTSEFARSFKELFHLSPMEFRTFCRRREFAA